MAAIAASIARSRDNVRASNFLDLDHLRDEFGMVREVRVHDDDKIAGCVLHAVDVGGAKAEFTGSRLEDYVGCGVEFLELFGDL
jgi:hypothetical protein